MLHHGFQSQIEFAKGENIETITMGDSYAWNVTPLNNRLFIKPLEFNVRTNMTIITNKRTYHFDLVAKKSSKKGKINRDLVYVVKFQYPRSRYY